MTEEKNTKDITTTDKAARLPALSVLLPQADYYSTVQNVEVNKIKDRMVSFAYEVKKVLKSHSTQVSIESIKEAFKCSMDRGLPVDSRKLAYVVPYGNEIQYMPGVKGYMFKVRQLKPGAIIHPEIVYEGDTFQYQTSSGKAEYTYIPAKIFRSDFNNCIGAFCYISYFENGKEFSFLYTMDKKELDLVKSKAKTQKVWGEWQGEMIKKSIVRRACKEIFDEDDEIARLNELDDKQYTLERKTPIQSNYAQVEPMPEETPAEPVEGAATAEAPTAENEEEPK